MTTHKLIKGLASALVGMLACTNQAMAQTINFEEKDYRRIGVYDTWEESPFRLGSLKGNCRVIKNFMRNDKPSIGLQNTSARILALQRSRYGSNTFGARIDLKEPFELTKEEKYVHVMIYKPFAGRAILIGLGKRPERTGQSAETEQFWALSSAPVEANVWTEVVFAIKGNGGIDIHSLVVVPDAESPHNRTEDFPCYIDNIEVKSESRGQTP